MLRIFPLKVEGVTWCCKSAENILHALQCLPHRNASSGFEEEETRRVYFSFIILSWNLQDRVDGVHVNPTHDPCSGDNMAEL